MPATSAIPHDQLGLFEEPALGHLAYLNDRDQIVAFPLWVDFDGTRMLASSPVGSRKGAALRKRSGVAVSVVSTKNPFHWLSVSGRVTEFKPDRDLTFIDRMSRKYLGVDYQQRTPREVFAIEIDRVSHSGSRG